MSKQTTSIITIFILAFVGWIPSFQINDMPISISEVIAEPISSTLDEFNYFWNHSKQGPYVPASEQNFIPQGMDYIEEYNWLVISGYRDDGRPSILTVIDRKSLETIKTVPLYHANGKPYTGHAGGVAISEDHVWVASNGTVYGLSLSDLIDSEDHERLNFSTHFATNNRASFVVYSDGILWVGEFSHRSKYPTDPSHDILNREQQTYHAWINGFQLHKVINSHTPPLPDFILSVPNKVQGLAFHRDKVILSQSYGRNRNSQIITYLNPIHHTSHANVKLQSKTVPLWFLDNLNKTSSLTIPPMSEEIVNIGNRIEILFESAAPSKRGKLPMLYVYSLNLR